MCKAISQIEQRELEAPGAVGLPRCLDLHYEEDFLEKRSHQIPPVFLNLLFIPNMAKAVYKVVKSPVVLGAFPTTNSCGVLSASNHARGWWARTRGVGTKGVCPKYHKALSTGPGVSQ